MNFLWTLPEIIEATGGKTFGPLPEGVFDISIDSRTLKPGDGFLALKGHVVDGHNFINQAVLAGATLCLVEEDKMSSYPSHVGFLFVHDTMEALERLGVFARLRTKAKIIAITGSVGKTSTKNGLCKALSPFGSVYGSPKSFNNHWGVPLTLARIPRECDYAVVEVGMNHAGEIRSLTKMIRPHIAVVTAVGEAHIGYFRDIHAIIDAKAEIFEGVQPGGIAILNADDSSWNSLLKKAKDSCVEKIISFGSKTEAFCRLKQAQLGRDHARFVLTIEKKDYALELGPLGLHMIYNILAIVAVVHSVGADIGQALQALSSFEVEKGRGKQYNLRHPLGAFVLIDETFNANPLSMKAALSFFKIASSSSARRIVVLGDMAELGDHSCLLHRNLLPYLVEADVNYIFLFGSEMKNLEKCIPSKIEVHFCTTLDELIKQLAEFLQPRDTLMLKASHHIGFSKVVEELIKMFPVEQK